MNRLSLIVPALVLGSLNGCFSTGCGAERALQEGINIVGGVSEKALEKADLTSLAINADADIHNPSYEVDTFIGTGVYARTTVRLNGVGLEANINGAGDGKGNPSEADKARLHETLNKGTFADDVVQKATSKPASN